MRLTSLCMPPAHYHRLGMAPSRFIRGTLPRDKFNDVSEIGFRGFDDAVTHIVTVSTQHQGRTWQYVPLLRPRQYMVFRKETFPQ
jgi:hypothetical protein